MKIKGKDCHKISISKTRKIFHNILLFQSYIFFVFVSVLINASVQAQPAATIDNLAVTVGTGLTVTVQGDFQNQNAGTIDNAGTVAVSGNWTNNASNTVFSTNSGKVQLNGTTAPQTIGGSYATSFYDLTLNNSATDTLYILGQNETVKDTLALTGSNMNLSGYLLTLGSSASSPGALTYNAGWLYGGTMMRWISASAISDSATAGLFPLGTTTDYRPFYMSAPTAAPALGGTISAAHVGVTGTTASSFTDINITIDRIFNSYWSVTSGNGLTGGTYNLQAGGTGFTGIIDSSQLRLVQTGSSVGINGINGGTNLNPRVKRTGLTAPQLTNYFYIGYPAGSGPLPVTLLEFDAKPDQSSVKVSWETVVEINADYFTVERSPDGENYDVIYNVPAAGTSTTVKDYSLTDNAPLLGTSFYRLKETDFDGYYNYYPPVKVHFDKIKSAFEIVSTRTLNGQIIITVLASVNENYDLYIYDTIGRLISHVNDKLTRGYQDMVVTIKGPAYGLHLVTLRTAQHSISKKIL